MSDPNDTRAAVEIDTALWLALRELVNTHEGASVAARAVAVAAQLCSRLNIPESVAMYAFVSNLHNERKVMQGECN